MTLALLQASWSRACAALGLMPADEPLRQQLLQAYAERQRHYHTQQHLAEGIALLGDTLALAARPGEVEMAWWFHDAVYQVRAGDNEARSARWARDALTRLGAGPGVAGRVHDLVMATRHDAVPDQADAGLLVDVDLAILGAMPARYDEFEAQVRAEYAWVPTWLFRRKRRAILQGFLARPRLYTTEALHARFEAPARRNLQRAIVALGGATGD